MMRIVLAAVVMAATAAALAEDAPAPEECLAKANTPFVVSHGGKTYRMTSEACRAQFLTEPERYSQLYDALLELEEEGTPLRAPASPSLVPS